MRIAIAPIVAALSLAVVGCQQPYSKDDPQANYKLPAIENTYELVASGKPPLSLVVNSGGWIKIRDLTSRTIVHTAQLPAEPTGLMVKLDDQLKGITYITLGGEKAIQVLPIDPEHRYELYYQR